jgi:hypothetical protein
MPETIIARFDAFAGQWVAHFERTPQVAFGGDLPVVAIRRLLAGTEAAPETYPLVCNWDRVGDGVLHRLVIWQPPRVLFPCPTCKGTGQYVGLSEVGPCKACGGRKMVVG